MTLLELLVKELPGRGGWPESTSDFYNLPPSVALYFHPAAIFPCLKVFFQKAKSDTEEVTREQYESAIASQQPGWSIDGLPPVGLRVEYTCKKFSPSKEAIIPGNWYVGTIIAYYDDCVWTSDNGIRPLDNTLFRPLRTEAGSNRQDSVDIIRSIIHQNYNGAPDDFRAEEIYDTISAGKIPGVELKK